MPGVTINLFFIFLLVLCAIAGGITYRARGGPLLQWPRPLEQMAFCSVLFVACALLGVPYIINVLAYAIAVAVCCTGHGQYFLSLAIKALEPERLDFLLRLFFGEDPRGEKKFEAIRGVTVYPPAPNAMLDLYDEMKRLMHEYGMKRLYWRAVAGMAITGGGVTLAPGIAAMFQCWWAGAAIALSGFIVKPAAYIISEWLGYDTEGGEWGFGAALWPVVMAAACAGVWVTVS